MRIKRMHKRMSIALLVFTITVMVVFNESSRPVWLRSVASSMSNILSFKQLSSRADIDIHDKDVLVLINIPRTGILTLTDHVIRHTELETPCKCKWYRSKCLCHNKHDQHWLFNAYNSTGFVCGEGAGYSDIKNSCPIDYWFESTGHDHRPFRRYHLITMMRDPVSRYVSEWVELGRHDWYFINEPRLWRKQSPEMQKKKLKCLLKKRMQDVTLEEFVACPDNPANNRMTKMLANQDYVNSLKISSPTKRNQMLLASAKNVLKRTAFFGLHDRPNDTQVLMEEVLGAKFNKSLSFKAMNDNYKAISPILKHKILMANDLDFKLYNFAKELFAARMAEWRYTHPQAVASDAVPSRWLSFMESERMKALKESQDGEQSKPGVVGAAEKAEDYESSTATTTTTTTMTMTTGVSAVTPPTMGQTVTPPVGSLAAQGAGQGLVQGQGLATVVGQGQGTILNQGQGLVPGHVQTPVMGQSQGLLPGQSILPGQGVLTGQGQASVTGLVGGLASPNNGTAAGRVVPMGDDVDEFFQKLAAVKGSSWVPPTSGQAQQQGTLGEKFRQLQMLQQQNGSQQGMWSQMNQSQAFFPTGSQQNFNLNLSLPGQLGSAFSGAKQNFSQESLLLSLLADSNAQQGLGLQQQGLNPLDAGAQSGGDQHTASILEEVRQLAGKDASTDEILALAAALGLDANLQNATHNVANLSSLASGVGSDAVPNLTEVLFGSEAVPNLTDEGLAENHSEADEELKAFGLAAGDLNTQGGSSVNSLDASKDLNDKLFGAEKSLGSDALGLRGGARNGLSSEDLSLFNSLGSAKSLEADALGSKLDLGSTNGIGSKLDLGSSLELGLSGGLGSKSDLDLSKGFEPTSFGSKLDMISTKGIDTSGFGTRLDLGSSDGFGSRLGLDSAKSLGANNAGTNLDLGDLGKESGFNLGGIASDKNLNLGGHPTNLDTGAGPAAKGLNPGLSKLETSASSPGMGSDSKLSLGEFSFENNKATAGSLQGMASDDNDLNVSENGLGFNRVLSNKVLSSNQGVTTNDAHLNGSESGMGLNGVLANKVLSSNHGMGANDADLNGSENVLELNGVVSNKETNTNQGLSSNDADLNGSESDAGLNGIMSNRDASSNQGFSSNDNDLNASDSDKGFAGVMANKDSLFDFRKAFGSDQAALQEKAATGSAGKAGALDIDGFGIKSDGGSNGLDLGKGLFSGRMGGNQGQGDDQTEISGGRGIFRTSKDLEGDGFKFGQNGVAGRLSGHSGLFRDSSESSFLGGRAVTTRPNLASGGSGIPSAALSRLQKLSQAHAHAQSLSKMDRVSRLAQLAGRLRHRQKRSVEPDASEVHLTQDEKEVRSMFV